MKKSTALIVMMCCLFTSKITAQKPTENATVKDLINSAEFKKLSVEDQKSIRSLSPTTTISKLPPWDRNRRSPRTICDYIPSNCKSVVTGAVINRVESAGNGLQYKVYLQEAATATNRKGIILLAHGDAGSINDGTLNEQCNALSKEGYVAATITYRSLDYPVEWNTAISNFKADFENYIQTITTKYNIVRSRVVVGGSSRGSNELFYVLIAGQGNGNSLITGIKGAILECSGGDNWKGSAITVPVAFMGNQIDNGQDNAVAAEFCAGLQNNTNSNVKNNSECLIIPGTGHCSDPNNQYTPFIVKKVKQWLP